MGQFIMADENNIHPSERGDENPEYLRLMSGTHRNPPQQLGAPGVSRIVFIRKPKGVEREDWVKESEAFARQLYFHIKEQIDAGNPDFGLQLDERKEGSIKPLTPNLQKRKGDTEHRLYLLNNIYNTDEADTASQSVAPDRYPAVHFIFLWQSMPVQIRMELHTEYITISSSVDLSRWGLAKKLGEMQHFPAAVEFSEALTKFNAIETERYKRVSAAGQPVPRAGDQNGLKATFQTIYYNLWDRFHEGIFDAPKGTAKYGLLDAVSGDYRTLILQRGKRGQFITPSGKAKFDPPFDVLARKPFARGEDVKRLETLMAFMKNAEHEPSAPDAKTGSVVSMEFTASRMLDGLCLHLSALGSPPPDGDTENNPPRVHTDLLYATHGDPWQLGRLSECGDTLGILRLVALLDQPLLGVAYHQMSKLEKDLEKVKTPEDLSNHIDRLREIGEPIEGGIAWRVERSQRARREFIELTELLRIDRIEGYQPYTQFVTRRLGGTYNAIDDIGKLHERLQDTITFQERRQTSQQLLGLQAQLTKYTGRIEKIQEQVEGGFWPILFPYYAGVFWAEVLGEAESFIFGNHVKIQIESLNLERELPLKLMVMSGAFYAGYAISKGRDPRNIWRGMKDIVTRAPRAISGAPQAIRKTAAAEWKKSKPALLDPRVVSAFELNYSNLETGQARETWRSRRASYIFRKHPNPLS
jgi:hypothetical protein